MEKSNILCRLYKYQNERFPIIFIFFTTFLVVLGSSSIVNQYEIDYFIVLIISLIVFGFMIHIRVVDEYRDSEFDYKHHKERPLQKNIVSLNELLVIDFFLLIIQFILILLFSLHAAAFFLIALGYTIISAKNFFLKNKILENLFFYHLLNIVQLIFLQLFIYSSLRVDFYLGNLWKIHIFFALFNITCLEIVRKIKCSELESPTNDTYSRYYGKDVSVSILIIFFFLSFLTSFIIILFSKNTYLFLAMAIIYLNIIIASINYIKKDSKFSQNYLHISAAIYYIISNLIIFFSLR